MGAGKKIAIAAVCVLCAPTVIALLLGIGTSGKEAIDRLGNNAALADADIVFQTTEYSSWFADNNAWIYGQGQSIGHFDRLVIDKWGEIPSGWMSIERYFQENPSVESECVKSASYWIAPDPNDGMGSDGVGVSDRFVLKPFDSYADGRSRELLEEFRADIAASLEMADSMRGESGTGRQSPLFDEFDRIDVVVTQVFDYRDIKVYGAGTVLFESVKFRAMEIPTGIVMGFRYDADESFVREEYANEFVSRLHGHRNQIEEEQ